jgi:hypothetical protein
MVTVDQKKKQCPTIGKIRVSSAASCIDTADDIKITYPGAGLQSCFGRDAAPPT